MRQDAAFLTRGFWRYTLLCCAVTHHARAPRLSRSTPIVCRPSLPKPFDVQALPRGVLQLPAAAQPAKQTLQGASRHLTRMKRRLAPPALHSGAFPLAPVQFVQHFVQHPDGMFGDSRTGDVGVRENAILDGSAPRMAAVGYLRSMTARRRSISWVFS